MKPPRESDGARTLRKRLNGSSVERTQQKCDMRANKSSKPVSYTQAAEANIRTTRMSHAEQL